MKKYLTWIYFISMLIIADVFIFLASWNHVHFDHAVTVLLGTLAGESIILAIAGAFGLSEMTDDGRNRRL